MSTTHKNYLRKVIQLAKSIYNNSKKSLTWGESLAWGHHTAKNNECELIEFVKKDKTVSKRVISTRVSDFIDFVGTGSYNTYQKAIDLAKYTLNQITGKNRSTVISFANGYTKLA